MATSDDLLSVEDLAKRAGLSVNQINDYIGRQLIRVAQRKGRKRFVRPESTAVLAALRAHLGEHGTLTGAPDTLRRRFPAYYKGH